MIWQDYIIMTVGFTFAFAMFPSIFSANKPSRWTCLITSIGLAILSAMFGTLGLWLSMTSNIFSTACWSVLAVQTWRNI